MNQICQKRLALTAVAAVAFALPLTAWPRWHENKSVRSIGSPDSRQCIFFQLTGVSEADPVNPNNPWFAVAKTHGGYKEIVAMLMMAKATGIPISVGTTGALACGEAEVGQALFY